MKIKIINPKNKLMLNYEINQLQDSEGNIFPIVNKVPRITSINNYAASFGMQWNKFYKTQIDTKEDNLNLSKKRFFAQTGWQNYKMENENILEAGSGAGRFSKVVLENTLATLYSIDYSNAVEANYNNNSHIAPERFNLYQASIYEMPFEDNSFDKVFCFGVLQHTPDFEMSIKSLINKTKYNGEIVVDFYPIKGWWTKIQFKYLFRFITKNISPEYLLRLIEYNIDWLITLSKILNRNGLKFFNRFIPIVNISVISNIGLNEKQFRELVVLDTFDMLSPEHDHPQKIKDVKAMFERNGVSVTFAGFIEYEHRFISAVIRGVKIK